MSFAVNDQESLLAVIAFDDEPGGCTVAAQMLPADAWDLHHGEVFKKLGGFVDRFKSAPRESTFDIIERLAAAKPDNAEHYRDIYRSMVSIWEGGLNREYVFSRAQLFGRHARIRRAIGDALPHLAQITEDGVAKAERCLEQGRSHPVDVMDPGISSHDAEGFARAATERPDAPFLIGIDQLDEIGAGPGRGEVLLLAAAYGKGKSFGIQDFGLAGVFLNNAKVLFVTLEMSATKVVRRMSKRVFGYADAAGILNYTKFAHTAGGSILDLDSAHVDLKGLYDDGAYEDLKDSAAGLRSRAEFRVKGFPSGELTLVQLEAYLDYLAGLGFVPDIIVLDYLQIMKLGKAELKRQELGNLTVKLRGMAQRRNCALISALQLNREGMKHAVARGADISEDISAAHTADRLLVYNQSELEKDLGIARLWIDKARDGVSGREVLISQLYAAGQFCCDSTWMATTYQDMLDRYSSGREAA